MCLAVMVKVRGTIVCSNNVIKQAGRSSSTAQPDQGVRFQIGYWQLRYRDPGVSTWALSASRPCQHLRPASTWAITAPGPCQHLGPVSTSALSAPGPCQHLALSASGPSQHLGPVSIWALSASLLCHRLGPVSIWALSASGTCQHLGPVSIWALSASGPVTIWALSPSGPCHHLGPVTIWALSASGPCQHLGPVSNQRYTGEQPSIQLISARNNLPFLNLPNLESLIIMIISFWYSSTLVMCLSHQHVCISCFCQYKNYKLFCSKFNGLWVLKCFEINKYKLF